MFVSENVTTLLRDVDGTVAVKVYCEQSVETVFLNVPEWFYLISEDVHFFMKKWD